MSGGGARRLVWKQGARDALPFLPGRIALPDSQGASWLRYGTRAKAGFGKPAEAGC